MKQITIRVDADWKVDQIVAMLSDLDFPVEIDVDSLWTSSKEPASSAVTIVESEIGPLISNSRASVYDVMEASDQGHNASEIGKIYNLSPHQVAVALDYIEQHREELEPKLREILHRAAERESYHRALVAEREQHLSREMTPARMALNDLIEESRRKRSAI